MIKKNNVKKIITSVLLAVFTVTQFERGALAYPAAAPSFLEVPSARPPFQIVLPPELGTVQEISSGTGPVIVQIQTAHGSFEAQKNIQAILGHLKRTYGFNLLLLEGSSSKLYPELLEFFPGRNDLNQKAAEELTRKSLVKGDELFLLEDRTAQAYGIEDVPVYLGARKNFKEVLLAQEAARNFLADLNLQIERMTAAYLNPGLRTFLKSRENFETEIISFPAWVRELKQSALKNLQTDLRNPSVQFEWPMLARVLKIQEFENSINPEALGREKENFRKNISKLSETEKSEVEKLLNRPLSYSSAAGAEAARSVENMIFALPDDFPYQDYPNLKKLFGFLILQNEITPGLLTEELERVSEQIISKLSRSEQERKWSVLLKKYQTLQRLLALELTPAAYEDLLKDEESFRPSVLAEAFKVINDDGRVKNFDFGHLSSIDGLFEKSMEFYKSTKDRDLIMLQNIQKKMKEHHSQKAVVVTGGFHAPAFKDFFISKGFNYALISPKITSVQGREEYLKSVLQADGVLLKKSAMDLPRRMEMPAVQSAMGEDLAYIDAAMDQTLRKILRSELRAEAPKDEAVSEQTLEQSSPLDFDLFPAHWRYKKLQRVERLWRSSGVDKYGLLKYLMVERYRDIPGMRDFVIRLMGYFTRAENKSFDEAAGELIAAYKIEQLLAADYDVEILTLNRVIGSREFDVMFFIRPKRGKTAGGKGEFFFEEGVYVMEAKEDSSSNLQLLIRETVNGQVSYQAAVLQLVKQTGVPVKGIIVAAGGQSSSRDKTRKPGEFQLEQFSSSAKKNSNGAEREISVISVVTESFDVKKTPAPFDRSPEPPSLPQINRWFEQKLKLSNLFLEVLGPRFGLTLTAGALEGSPVQRSAYEQLLKREKISSDAVALQINEKQERARNFEAEYQIRETEADKWIGVLTAEGTASEKEAGEILDWYFLTHFKQSLADLVINLEKEQTEGDPSESLHAVWAWVKQQFEQRNPLRASARKQQAPPREKINLAKRLENSLFGPYGWIVVFANQPSITPAVSESEAEQVLREYFKPAVDEDNDESYRLLNKTLREEIVWKYGKDRQKAWDALRKIIAGRNGPQSFRAEVRAQTNILYPESKREEIGQWFKDKIGFGGVEVSGRYLAPQAFDRDIFTEVFNPWKLEYGIRQPWVTHELVPALDELTGTYDAEKEKKVLDVLVKNNLRKGKLSASWEEMPVIPEILFPLNNSPLISNGGSHSIITFNLIPGETSGTFLPVLIKTGLKIEEEAIFDGIFDRAGIKEFIGVVNLPDGTKGIVYRIIPALREVQGADLSLFITYDLLLMKAVPARLGTRFGTVPFDLANLTPYADMGKIKAFIHRYNQVYENESKRPRSELRTLSGSQESSLLEPVLGKDLDELKKIELELKNVKQSGPPVTLEFRGDKVNGDDDLQIIVKINGQRAGDFRLLNRPDLLRISWVYPFMSAGDQVSLENQGVMSTIVNWLAWEASVKNVNFENSGTMNLKLIYLYSKYFSIFLNDYGVYDSRNVGSVNLKYRTGRAAARFVSFESVSSQPRRYKIMSPQNLSADLDGTRTFEVGPGGQLFKVGDTGVPVPIDYYMDNTNRNLIISGKPRDFTIPRGNISRSELRSSWKNFGKTVLKFAAVTFLLVLINQVIIHFLLSSQPQLTVGVNRPDLADTAREYYQPVSGNYPEGVKILVKDNAADKNAVFSFIFHYVEDPLKYLKAVITVPFLWIGSYAGVRFADYLLREGRTRLLNRFYAQQSDERYSIFGKIDRFLKWSFWAAVLSYTAGLVLNGADVFFYHAVADYIPLESSGHRASPGDFLIWFGAGAVVAAGIVFVSRAAVETLSLKSAEKTSEISRSEVRSLEPNADLKWVLAAAKPLAENSGLKIIDLKSIPLSSGQKSILADKLADLHADIFKTESYLNDQASWETELSSNLTGVLVLIDSNGEILGLVLTRRNLKEEIDMEKFGVTFRAPKGSGRFLLLTFLSTLAGKTFDYLYWESNFSAFGFYDKVLRDAGVPYQMRTPNSFVIYDHNLRYWKLPEMGAKAGLTIRAFDRDLEKKLQPDFEQLSGSVYYPAAGSDFKVMLFSYLQHMPGISKIILNDSGYEDLSGTIKGYLKIRDASPQLSAAGVDLFSKAHQYPAEYLETVYLLEERLMRDPVFSAGLRKLLSENLPVHAVTLELLFLGHEIDFVTKDGWNFEAVWKKDGKTQPRPFLLEVISGDSSNLTLKDQDIAFIRVNRAGNSHVLSNTKPWFHAALIRDLKVGGILYYSSTDREPLVHSPDKYGELGLKFLGYTAERKKYFRKTAEVDAALIQRLVEADIKKDSRSEMRVAENLNVYVRENVAGNTEIQNVDLLNFETQKLKIVQRLGEGGVLAIYPGKGSSAGSWMPASYAAILQGIDSLAELLSNALPSPKRSGKITATVHYVLREGLKNAFVHGNQLNAELPIYLHFEFQGPEKRLIRIRIFDSGTLSRANRNAMQIAQLAGLHGDGLGVMFIGSKGWNYQRTPLNLGGDTPGTEVTLTYEDIPVFRSELRAPGVDSHLKTRLEFTDNLFPLEWMKQLGKDALMKALNALGLLTDPDSRTYSESEIQAAKKFLGIERGSQIPDAFILGADLALNNGGLVLIDTFLKDSPVAIAADSKEFQERLAAYNKDRVSQGKKPVPVVLGIGEAEKVFAATFKDGVNLYGFASPDEISEEWARILKDKLQVFNSRRMEIFAETFGVSSLLESFKARFAFAKSA